MPLMMAFTAIERERLGVLVNNLGVYAAQLMLQTSPEFSRHASANLARAKTEDEPLLKRLDELAREQGGESSLRVIEDTSRMPGEVAQTLTLVLDWSLPFSGIA
jgi:hypothetical protein